MKRFAVDIAEDCGGADAQLAAGTQDAHSDLTAIGDQDFPEHGWFAMQRDFSMRGGKRTLAVRLACPIVCGVRRCGEFVGEGQ